MTNPANIQDTNTLYHNQTALERTYLAYHRTGMVLAMLATATAQLTVINHAPSPSPSFGFYVIGKPLAAALAACALINSIVGGLRWWRLQQGLLRGVAISGGREVLLIAGIIGAVRSYLLVYPVLLSSSR